MSTEIEAFLKMVKEDEIEHISLRFTDLRGKWQQLAMHRTHFGAEDFENGLMFDGSSISGWKAIHQSDMVLKPDPARYFRDPFSAEPMVILFCDILEPDTGRPYGRDPRSIAQRAMAWLAHTGAGDTAYFGSEAEFFVFDDVRFSTNANHCFYRLDSEEMPANSGTEYDSGNLGHRPGPKGGYFPVSPVDHGVDLRAEMVTTMVEMGLDMDKHHHEVAPAQHELGMVFDQLVRAADNLQIYKYVVHMVAQTYGKSVTFMPKPIFGDNGSGMHVHQSIWQEGKNRFAGSLYADLSESCLHYIGGIIKHAKAINAFTNPTTNSYKRLVPGYEAPVLLAYSARNRSASCRIPHVTSANGKRVEVRFPDPSANPYLAFSALLMAGLDGIANRIHPGDAMDKDLYDLPPEELSNVPTVASSLSEALTALDGDRDFLKAGEVFDDDIIDAFITLKNEEVESLSTAPHPIEFSMYYSV